MKSLAARRYEAMARVLRSANATSSTYRGPPFILVRSRLPVAWQTPPMAAPSAGLRSPARRSAGGTSG
eukprot:3716897-Lingulodinium_polyedra.AAC.1